MLGTQKNSKKRPALYQAGPNAKKVHLEKRIAEKSRVQNLESNRKVESKSGMERADGVRTLEIKETTKKRRSKPVTKASEQDSAESDEDGDDLEGEDGDEWLDGEGEKDQKSSRESHKAQKTLLSQRRSQKPNAPLLLQAKEVWSLLRQKSLSSAERQGHLKTLTSILFPNVSSGESGKTKGARTIDADSKLKDLILNHSFSRIIQTLLKYSSPIQREQIAQQLEGSYKELSQSKYSRFLVCKILKVVSGERRRKIMGEFEGSVVAMIKHKEAGKVLADAFEVFASEWERAVLVRGFFGKEVTLFDGSGFKNESEQEKTKTKRGLKALLEGMDVEKRQRILASTKENLLAILNYPDKGGVTHAIVHRALWEYLSTINDTTIIISEGEQEKMRREIFESCQEVLAEMVHTKDGSRVVREFLAWGTAKDRKQVLKVLKPHLEKMCLDDEAQIVLFTALDVIDDTKLLAKTLVDPIVSSANTLYNHTQGRRSLLYLLVPRSRRHFTPVQVACLEETDSIRERTSKKSREVREEEVRRAASQELVGWVEKEGGAVVKEASGCLVLGEVMLYAEGDKEGANQTLFKALRPSQAGAESKLEKESGLIDLSPASRLYKTLLQGGHYNKSTQRVERVPSSVWDASAFAVGFVDEVGRDATVAMCIGRGNGAFVVAELVEALNRGMDSEEKRQDIEEARKTVKGWFGKEVIEMIERGEAKGKKVLLEKLESLPTSKQSQPGGRKLSRKPSPSSPFGIAP